MRVDDAIWVRAQHRLSEHPHKACGDNPVWRIERDGGSDGLIPFIAIREIGERQDRNRNSRKRCPLQGAGGWLVANEGHNLEVAIAPGGIDQGLKEGARA